MLTQLAPAFEAETGIALEVVPSLGSSGANAAAADRLLGLSVATRDLTAKETARGLRVAAVFRTPFGLATSRHDLQNFRSDEIAQLYQADKPLWPDGMPILIVLRPVDDSSDTFLGGLFPGMADALARLHKRPDLSLAATDRANADMGERTKGSLIGTALTQVTTEKRNLRFVAIDGVDAQPREPRERVLSVCKRHLRRRAFRGQSGSRRFRRVSHHARDPIPAAKGRDRRRWPVRRSRNRLAALVSWLGLAVALIIAIVAPVAYFGLNYAEVRYDLSFTAQLTANRLAKYIYTHQELWQYQLAPLAELLKVPEARRRPAARVRRQGIACPGIRRSAGLPGHHGKRAHCRRGDR